MFTCSCSSLSPFFQKSRQIYRASSNGHNLDSLSSLTFLGMFVTFLRCGVGKNASTKIFTPSLHAISNFLRVFSALPTLHDGDDCQRALTLTINPFLPHRAKEKREPLRDALFSLILSLLGIGCLPAFDGEYYFYRGS